MLLKLLAVARHPPLVGSGMPPLSPPVLLLLLPLSCKVAAAACTLSFADKIARVGAVPWCNRQVAASNDPVAPLPTSWWRAGTVVTGRCQWMIGAVLAPFEHSWTIAAVLVPFVADFPS